MSSVAFYNTEVFPDNRIFEDDEYAESYRIFAEIFQDKGGSTYIVRGLNHYAGENTFDEGWKYEGNAWVRVTERFSVDLILDRGFDLPTDQTLRVINSAEMTERCKKQRTAELFPDHCPLTIRVENPSEWNGALEKMKTDMVVLKPLDSYGGYGVFIGKKEEAQRHAPDYPFLLQEFIDTSKGIPGLCEGMHDLRLIFIGDSLTDCYLRQPAQGKMMSNVAQGGSIRQIPLKDIPQQARALAFTVDKVMADMPERIYSVDMGLHDAKTWKIIELNAPPGMPIPREDYNIRAHMEFLADHLLKYARSVR